MYKNFLFLVIIMFCIIRTNAQKINVSGLIKNNESGIGIAYAMLIFQDNQYFVCDSTGRFFFQLNKGKYNIEVRAVGYKATIFSLDVKEGSMETKVLKLKSTDEPLADVNITAVKTGWGTKLQTEIVGTTIYTGKKNEIIEIGKISANTSINSARQLYASVPGVNIIENDEAGIQLGIATRGLNPNRTTEFNSRQNGYDISADPIGYPETYYTPPSDGLSSIEIIRGAASLQYGTQFGGLLNFRFKDGPKDKPFELTTKQTAGSYGFFNSFNSVGGQYKKVNYYGFYNYKRGDGWRPNSGFDVHNAYGAGKYVLSKKMTLGIEYTFMYYTMQQPGGLTDTAFGRDARQSVRDRNWFSATWNLPALTLNYTMDENNLLTSKVYALIADRKNVGDLNAINQPDNLLPRTVMSDKYRNIYMETRYIHHYNLGNNLRSAILAGIRFYHGDTHRMQGYNYTGSNANYSFGSPDSLQIDYRFPSYNAAVFAENVFQITDKFSITPGARFEYIQTNGEGYTVADTSENIKTWGNEKHVRKFPLLGIGLEYKIFDRTDIYANFSQNYSPVNFSDIIIIQPGMKVDPNLKDVKGYNADLGYRGQIKNIVNFDLSIYYLLYKNRIGTLLQTDGDENIYRYETNISNSRSIGSELYATINFLHLWHKYQYSNNELSLFGSVAYTNSKYIHAPNNRKQFDGNWVEYAAPWINRFGINYKNNNWMGSIEYSYTSTQYSDASNSNNSIKNITDQTAATGLIPAYHTFDFTMSYQMKKWIFSFSANNFTNTKYFTRRTTGFPGPGIIPSMGSAFYTTVQFKL